MFTGVPEKRAVSFFRVDSPCFSLDIFLGIIFDPEDRGSKTICP
jgi:hypothetical protein